MKSIVVVLPLLVGTYALVNDINEDCIVINPIGNTIVMAGDKMKISWTNSHVDRFASIYLVQSDGLTQPIVIAEDVPTSSGQVVVDLPSNLIPSNAYYMTLGVAPYHCQSGNLRILAASSVPPDSKTPDTFRDQIDNGRYPHQAPSDARTLMEAMPLTLAILLTSFVLFSLT
ncbi:uncharacterized protein B0P05DRAFT_539534 [Gilbertella persicaria]|uniref:Yeast cell wall synthesis Kre9/Knh1-like N-terminal domain-containing protein n=1 Tax=Rhizopus stolonifer TaxID=4846 RepID=A0A367JRZ2_RHIST|nr:uncharacterized protein B0P05DRAFT_539534 [Gilbertella persicaria]KAI8080765.1 hypothetical protein B0P05DRAFT_539534 [Gilbertella persicaria]RCH92730.1 hypothetical protein CU098_001441 [Rhizopus stolonifer]